MYLSKSKFLLQWSSNQESIPCNLFLQFFTWKCSLNIYHFCFVTINWYQLNKDSVGNLMYHMWLGLQKIYFWNLTQTTSLAWKTPFLLILNTHLLLTQSLFRGKALQGLHLQTFCLLTLWHSLLIVSCHFFLLISSRWSHASLKVWSPSLLFAS